MRTCHGTDDVEGVIDVGDPVAQCFVHGVFEGAGARDDRYDLCAQQFHTEYVGLLALDVGLPHVDHAGQAEAGRHGRGGHAVHTGTGFRDDALLAHLLGQQYLADAVVDFVRAGVVQLFAFKVNARAAEVIRKSFGKVERIGAADVIALEVGELALKLRIVLSAGVLILQLQDQRHQGFGNKAATKVAKHAIGIG